MTTTIDEKLAAIPALGTEIDETSWAFHEGEFRRLADAKVSIATHTLNYGTGVFEGIRAYWNAEQEQLYAFRVRDHYARMRRSAAMMRTPLPGEPDALAALTIELLRKNGLRTDVYVRPLAYKAARSIKVALAGLRPAFSMFVFPLGAYLPTDGLTASVVSWRRTPDNAIPARGKLTGAYINTALATDEAHAKDADEAIFLTEDGHVSEGGSSNIFIVREGVLATPPVTADILEGITRDSVMTLARELGYTVVEREIDRTELYLAEEVFFCGTGAQVAPCVMIDRRAVGDGRIGPIAKRIGDLYFAIARGDERSHAEWRSAVFD